VPHIVACSREQLADLEITEHRCLLIVLDDPAEAEAPAPPHKLAHVLDTVTLRFADLDPAECQDRWNAPLLPWNKPPAELVMGKEHGKRLWSCLLRKRDPVGDVYVIVDRGDLRALSAAQGVADGLGLPRDVIHVWDGDESRSAEDEPANRHVWDVVKASRYTVVG
jgi:hypothetical protein